MKRHFSLIPLSKEHHKVLLLAQVLKSDVPDYKGMPTDLAGKRTYALGIFEQEMIPHFEKEEQYLFKPALQLGIELADLADQLTEAHREIKAFFEKLRTQELGESDLNELGLLIERNVRKEEREFFQLLQERMSEEELKKIGKHLED